MHDAPRRLPIRHHTTRLRTAEFNAFLLEQGFAADASNADIARWLGVAEASISRVRDRGARINGSPKQQPGPVFFSALAKKLPADVPLQRFFEFGETPALAAAA